MKKITIKLMLVMLFIIAINETFAQTVSMFLPTISSGSPINIQSNSYISLNIIGEVKLSSAPSDSNPGTIKIYYQQDNYSQSISPTGGNEISLLFNGGTSATQNFNVKLYWNDFDVKGGNIYVEYKTFSGIVYKSSKYPIIKNAILGSGYVNVNNITNAICCDQTIRYGDKPTPIANSHIIENSNITTSWSFTGGSTFYLGNDGTAYLDYLTNSTTLYRTLQSGNYRNKSNTITINVVPTPILTNDINVNNLTVNSDGYYELSRNEIMNLSGFKCKVNLNILEDPSHKIQRDDNITNLDSYKWEYRNEISNTEPWITIPNASSAALDFSNPSELTDSKDIYYIIRRIAIYQNISRVSNTIKVLVRGLNNNNSICCDQSLKITSPTEIESPNLITGSTPVYINPNFDPKTSFYSISYQWQSQEINRSTGIWTDIPDATSKDYLPLPLTVVYDGRGSLSPQSTYNYRRIAKNSFTTYITGNKKTTVTDLSYSNKMILSAYMFIIPTVKLYPNPTSSILNIEDTDGTFINPTISIVNISGNVVAPNSYSIISSSLITLDVSNFNTGTYYIDITTRAGRGRGRANTRQFSFIKQ